MLLLIQSWLLAVRTGSIHYRWPLTEVSLVKHPGRIELPPPHSKDPEIGHPAATKRAKELENAKKRTLDADRELKSDEAPQMINRVLWLLSLAAQHGWETPLPAAIAVSVEQNQASILDEPQ